MSTIVSLSHCKQYQSKLVASALCSALEPLGGIGCFVQPGQRVLLKPNFVRGRPAELAINTHPVFIVEVARLVREAGGRPVVGDSPALGSTHSAAAHSGLAELARAADLPLVEFRHVRKVVAPSGRVLRVATEALDADVVISLPKFKVHVQVGLTLAIKNTFGCIRARRKALYHFQIGHRPGEFARMLIDVSRTVAPALHLADGILALERNGPTHGDPRALGIVLASTDPVAMDRVGCDIAGADPETIPTLVAAREIGWGENDLGGIRVVCEGRELAPPYAAAIPALAERPFVLASRTVSLSFSPRQILLGAVRQLLVLLRGERKSA